MSQGCETCRLLSIGDGSEASWIVHTSVDEAIRIQIPKARVAALKDSLLHMELAKDGRVSLRKRLVTQLKRRLRAMEGAS